eukprot:jgi/Galph1/1558/GphlegSOOS_G238.1
MTKKLMSIVKLALPAGKATPAPPVGPALGQHGINIVTFCKEYNAKTSDKIGLIIPAEIYIYEDKSFNFILKTPPGSDKCNQNKVGSLSYSQLLEIANTKLVDLNTSDISKAVKIVEGTAKNMVLKTIANANFNETVELHINLAIDPKYNDQQLRASVFLPYGTGKIIKIAAITNSIQIEIAKSAGADLAGGEEILDNIITNNLEFNYLITTPDFIPKIAKFGKVLGPRGLMPSPKTGTVTNDIANTIKIFKSGKIEYRADKTGIVHIGFGKINFNTEHLFLNFESIKDSINKNKPSGVKGKYWQSCCICSTMSPSIHIDSIDTILEQLKELSLVEASELVKAIETTFNVDASSTKFISTDSSQTSQVNGSLQANAEEKTEFDVILEVVPTDKKIAVLKAVRAITGLGLKEAKELVDSVPQTLKKAISKENAEQIKKDLETVGAQIKNNPKLIALSIDKVAPIPNQMLVIVPNKNIVVAIGLLKGF